MRVVTLLTFFLLLSGCCTTKTAGQKQACDVNWEDNREAAAKGWDNVQNSLAPQPHPTLHEGMTAEEVESELGPPPRKKKSKNLERWMYPERELVVLMKDGTVVGWEQ